MGTKTLLMPRGWQGLLAICTIWVLGACGPETERRRGGDRILPLVESTVQPASYRIADESCQARSDTVTLTGTTIRAWVNNEVVERDVEVSGFTTTDKTMSTPAVSAVTWGDVFERICDFRKPRALQCADERGREKGWRSHSSRGGLRFCEDHHDYGRDSYEGVALTGLHFVAIAAERYQRLTGLPAPASVRMTVLPEFIDYYDHFKDRGRTVRLKTWITHNLAYFPSDQLLAIFPERKDKERGMTGFFWESAFVLAHEYGHHIDAIHTQQQRAVAFEWDPVAHRMIDRQAISEDGASARGQMEGAVAEAFADLSAWYAVGASAESVSGIPELGVDRNVASAKFRNGEDKILTPEAAQLFLGDGSNDADSTVTNFHDIHMVGAVLAHTLDETFAAWIAGASGDREGEDPQGDANLTRRYRMLLTFLTNAYKGIETLEPDTADQRVLTPVAGAIEDALAADLASFPLTDDVQKRSLESEVCRTVAARLPALIRAPFADAAGACGAP